MSLYHIVTAPHNVTDPRYVTALHNVTAPRNVTAPQNVLLFYLLQTAAVFSPRPLFPSAPFSPAPEIRDDDES